MLQAQRRAEQNRAARKRDQPPSPVLEELLEAEAEPPAKAAKYASFKPVAVSMHPGM